MQNRPKTPLSGWLNIHKPRGLSSMQVLGALKRLMRPLKIGHAGTLDPEADGVLPIAFGEATKLIPLLHDALKAYRFTVRWGEATNTDDIEGAIIATHDHRPTADAIRAALPAFIGTIDQVPPAFSAVKVNGVRAYAAARAGEVLALTARPVYIDDFELVDRPDADHAVFQVTCGTGTYVRSLARDLAVRLGTVAHCTGITRVFVGPFTLTNTISLDSLEEMPYESRVATLWPLLQGLDDIPAMAVTPAEAQRLSSGNPVRFLSKADAGRLPDVPPGAPCLAVCGDAVIAICTVDLATLTPTRVINN